MGNGGGKGRMARNGGGSSFNKFRMSGKKFAVLLPSFPRKRESRTVLPYNATSRQATAGFPLTRDGRRESNRPSRRPNPIPPLHNGIGVQQGGGPFPFLRGGGQGDQGVVLQPVEDVQALDVDAGRAEPGGYLGQGSRFIFQPD